MKMSLRTMAIASIAVSMLFAAPLAMAKEKGGSAAKGTSAASVQNKKTQQVAYLGVGVEPLHPAFWAHLRDVLEHKQGLLVAQVVKNSPADKAGVKVNDILLTYGDQKLYSPEQLVGLVRADKAGRQVKFGIVRNGKLQEINVTLGKHAMQMASRKNRRTTLKPSWSASPSTPAGENNRWDSFDSLSLNSLGNNRYKVTIGYETKDGKIEHRTFEGTREELYKDILAQKKLPDNERQHLLRALDMRGADIQFDFPGVYYTPDGHMLWDFHDLDSIF